MQTQSPTTADLTAAFIASGKTITQCEPANAVPPSPQARPVVSEKAAKRVKAAIAKTDAPAKPAKKADAKKAPVKAKTPTVRATVNPGKTSLASIVAELGVNAKAARSILRRHMTKPEGGWTFDAAAAKRVRALLSPKA